MHLRSTPILVLTLALLVGCGGGSGNNTTNNNQNNTPPPPPNSPAGVYQGTASNTSGQSAFETIILPNNTVWALYGTISGNVFLVAGVITGAGSSTSTTFTSPVTDFNFTGQILSGTVNATYTVGTSINGTLAEPAAANTTFTGTAIPASDFNYNIAASIANIVGGWTGALLDGSAANITITSTGSFTGSNQGCNFSGTITPDSSGKNFFTVSVTFGASPCTTPGASASGVAVNYLLSDNVTHQLVAAVSSGTSFGTVFIANR